MPNRAEADFLENQTVVLTVPASFDDVARNLTMQAAQGSGAEERHAARRTAGRVLLLARPERSEGSHAHGPRHALPGRRCRRRHQRLQFDPAAEETGELTFIREAVGDHLLLGGDNMDLALARQVETTSAAGRQTRRGPVRHARAVVPAGEGSAAGAEAAREHFR